MKIQTRGGRIIGVRPVLGNALIRMGRAISAEDDAPAEQPAAPAETVEAVQEQPRQKRKYVRRDMTAE